MKKLLAIGLLLGATFVAAGANVTVVIPSGGGFSNLFSGPGNISQLTITSMATNAGIVRLWDTPTNTVYYTNSSYTNIVSYLTNYITTYTNYFGATNSFTNLAMVDIPVQVAGSTNVYTSVFYGGSPTNTTTVFNGSYNFLRGAWITNASVAGAVSVTATYTK